MSPSRRTAAPNAVESEETLSIGELARLGGVSTRTIRYYEELGILPEPHRTEGGTRRYTRDNIFYVEGALALKQLGFGLEEIAELGEFALRGNKASDRTQTVLQAKLADLKHRIRVLEKLEKLIQAAAKSSTKDRMAVPELLRWVGEMNASDSPKTHT